MSARTSWGSGYPVGFEDIEEGRRSQRKVATLRFNAAVFGHGRPIHSGASERIRSKWGRRTPNNSPLLRGKLVPGISAKERALERTAPATSSVRVARCSQHTRAFDSRTEPHLNHLRMTLPERFARPKGRTKAGPIVEWLYF